MKEDASADNHYCAGKISQQRKGQSGYKMACSQYAGGAGESHWNHRPAAIVSLSDKGNAGGGHQKGAGTHHHRKSGVCAHSKEKDKRHTGGVQADARWHQGAENKIADDGCGQHAAVEFSGRTYDAKGAGCIDSAEHDGCGSQ